MKKLELMREQMQKFNGKQLNDLSGGFVSSSHASFEQERSANVNVDVAGHTCDCGCGDKGVIIAKEETL